MSAPMRVRPSLAARLPDPTELQPARSGGEAPPEELRLAPIAPRSASQLSASQLSASEARAIVSRPPAITLPDARQLALLDATASRLADVDHLARALRPDLAAQLGDSQHAIADLARELRAIIAERTMLEATRIARSAA